MNKKEYPERPARMTFAKAVTKLLKVTEIYRPCWPDDHSIYYDWHFKEVVFNITLTEEDLKAEDWTFTK